MHPQAVTMAPEAVRRHAARLADPELTATHQPRRRWLLWGVTIISLCWMWASSWDHPLYPPDEGRYASVSMRMAEGGSWLVPEYEGRVHLTKPPLVYWAQAACIGLLGVTELAVRAPSLLAASLLALATAGLGAHLGGRRVAAMSIAILCVMPLYVIVSRLAITDAVMSLCWFGALAAGYRAIESGRLSWVVAMWACIALGLFTKGPVVLTPVGVLMIWLALAGRLGHSRRLHLLIGLPLAAVPILIWALMVVNDNPDAWTLWRNQILGRVVGTGDHPEPIWFYVPIFLGGLFPATAMLVVPGWNLSWRAAWAKLRSGGADALLALAVVVPLAMFSLISGKLASYLLPIAPPLAILTAMMLERWLTGESDRPAVGTRPPEVVATLTICLSLFPIGCVAAALMFEPTMLWMALPLLAMPLASGWMWWSWKRRPSTRASRLLALWVVVIGTWLYVFEAEDAIVRPISAAALLDEIRQTTGREQPSLATYGFTDSTFTFYNRRLVPRVRDPQELGALLIEHGSDLVLVAERGNWAELAAADPELVGRFKELLSWRLWRGRDTIVLRPTTRQTVSTAAGAGA